MQRKANRLGDLVSLKRGVSWDAAQERQMPAPSAYPVIRIPNVKASLTLDDLLYVKLPPAAAQAARATVGMTIMVGSNGNPARVGNPVFISKDDGFLFASFLMAAEVRDKSAADPKFVFHLIASPAVQDIITRSVQGSTGLKNLSATTIQELHVPNLSFAEQRRIAEILDTLDDAIRKTEQVIAKLQQMKQGLLHDLLTRGIDENGELRDPRRHPEQFKESELGLVPNEWDIAHFGQLVQSAVLGTARRGAAGGETIPLLKMGNLGWGTVGTDSVEVVTTANVPDWRALLLARGDLLFNTRNTPELVGKTAAWNDELPVAIADNNILRVRFVPGISGFFVSAYMSHGRGKVRVHALATGTTSVAAIYWRSLQQYSLPKPSSEEQARIVDALAVFNARVAREAREFAKLQVLKHGLMDDLLTGRVRVNVTEDTAA